MSNVKYTGFQPIVDYDAAGLKTLNNQLMTIWQRMQNVNDLDIRDNAVTETAISDDAITTAKLQDDAITEAKINALAVTRAKLQDNAVDADVIINGAIESYNLANDAVTDANIVNGTINGVKITERTIIAEHIAADEITANEIAVNTLTTALISTEGLNANVIKTGIIDTSLLMIGDPEYLKFVWDENGLVASDPDEATSFLKISETGLVMVKLGVTTVNMPISGDASFAGSMIIEGNSYVGDTLIVGGSTDGKIKVNNASNARVAQIDNLGYYFYDAAENLNFIKIDEDTIEMYTKEPGVSASLLNMKLTKNYLTFYNPEENNEYGYYFYETGTAYIENGIFLSTNASLDYSLAVGLEIYSSASNGAFGDPGDPPAGASWITQAYLKDSKFIVTGQSIVGGAKASLVFDTDSSSISMLYQDNTYFMTNPWGTISYSNLEVSVSTGTPEIKATGTGGAGNGFTGQLTLEGYRTTLTNNISLIRSKNLNNSNTYDMTIDGNGLLYWDGNEIWDAGNTDHVIFGSNNTGVIQSANGDTVTKAGFYSSTTASSNINGVNSHIISTTWATNIAHALQIGAPYTDATNFSMRVKTSSIWTDWYKIWNESNFDPSDYLKLTAGSGCQVTGNIIQSNARYLYGQHTNGSTNIVVAGINSSNQILLGHNTYETLMRGSKFSYTNGIATFDEMRLTGRTNWGSTVWSYSGYIEDNGDNNGLLISGSGNHIIQANNDGTGTTEYVQIKAGNSTETGLQVFIDRMEYDKDFMLTTGDMYFSYNAEISYGDGYGNFNFRLGGDGKYTTKADQGISEMEFGGIGNNGFILMQITDEITTLGTDYSSLYTYKVQLDTNGFRFHDGTAWEYILHTGTIQNGTKLSTSGAWVTVIFSPTFASVPLVVHSEANGLATKYRNLTVSSMQVCISGTGTGNVDWIAIDG